MNTREMADFKAALKTLARGQDKIKAAREDYQKAREYMANPDTCKHYSAIQQEQFKKATADKLKKAMDTEVAAMSRALNIVREYRSFPGENISLDNPKLQSAINLVAVMGKSLSHADQIGIIENFRGDMASLHFISGLFKKQGLYYGDYAESLTAAVSNQALEDMEYCLNSYEMFGKWPEDKLYWTGGEFDKALDRYGFSADIDPWIEALKSLKDGQSVDANRAVAKAVYQIQHAPENGMSDADKAELFNKTTEQIAESRANAEKQMIIEQTLGDGEGKADAAQE